MTSNVGSHILSRETNEISQRTRDRVMDCFKEKNFPLEFLNRIEEVVMFVSRSTAFFRIELSWCLIADNVV